jgi:signal transduction histidine kinase/CheY-like chemotaxis protein
MHKSAQVGQFWAHENAYGQVYRDFEVSRLSVISEAIQSRPVFHSVLYLSVVLFWTISMSYGAALHGPNTIAVNLSPHVALFTACVGIVTYPKRLTWVPVLALAGLFFVPAILPFSSKPMWITMPEVTWGLLGFLWGANMLSGVLIGHIVRQVYALIARKFPPLDTALLVTAVISVAFLVICTIQFLAVQKFASTLDPAHLVALGFDENYSDFALNRTLRGTAVVGGFMVAILNMPTRASLLRAAPILGVFPALALMHQSDGGGYPMMDVGLLALLLALTLPARVAPLIVIVGVAIYSAMTGAYLTDTAPRDFESFLLQRYAILMLFIIVLAMALRSRLSYDLAQREASIRRLSTVRNFAGVGLFAINVPRDMMRVDPAAQRLVGLPASGDLEALLSRFESEDQEALRRMILSGDAGSHTLLVRLAHVRANGEQRILRVHLWSEQNLWREHIAYGMMVEVTDEHKRQRALSDALGELSMRQERQKQLFSIVSHELRTPASVISMLIDELKSGEDLAETTSQMREASSQLLNVLDDMRQAVNPEKNQRIHHEAYVPADVAESLRNTYQLLARGNQMRLSVELEQGARSTLKGDAKRIKQVLGNLVRNGIIHSNGSEIRIAYQELPQDLVDRRIVAQGCWTVTDDGVGIPEADVERLFEPFERGSQDARNQADGSGLGLYIAKQTIELLGGELTYFTSPQGGAGYRIWLPDPLEKAVVHEEEDKEDLYSGFAKMSVLVAEDNALVAKITTKQLSRVFGSIRLASNGREAWEAIREEQPDILLTDLFMPEMTGDELVRALRSDGVTIPIIGLTAAVVGDDTARFVEAGVTAVMSKPLNVSNLCQTLQKEMGKTVVADTGT